MTTTHTGDDKVGANAIPSKAELVAMEGADLAGVSDDDLYHSIRMLRAFSMIGDDDRKAEVRRREGELRRREHAPRGPAAAGPRLALPSSEARGRLGKILDTMMAVHERCDTKRQHGARTGAWTYLLSKGLDPGRLPISVVCCPYLSPPFGAIAGLGTDAAGNVLMAETIMIDRDGRLATRFGDGSGKLKKLGADGKEWFKKAAVRMHGPADGPLVLTEGITTALAVWQATGHETWAVLGAKRFAVVPLPEGRELILAVDADDETSPGYVDTQACIKRLRARRSFKVARPAGTGGYDFCDMLRDQGADAVRDRVAAAAMVEIEVSAEGGEKRSLRDDGRALIEYDAMDEMQTLRATMHALITSDAPVYQRGPMLSHVFRLEQEEIRRDGNGKVLFSRPAGSLVIDQMGSTRLRLLLGEHIQFYVFDKGQQVPIPTPSIVAENLRAWKDGWRMRVLKGIAETPTMRDDGTLITDEGYDPASQIILDTGGLKFDSIPDKPTKEEAQAALKLFDEVLKDFPFDGHAEQDGGLVKCPSRSVALSMILSALIVNALPYIPAHLGDAAAAGTGKGLLGDVASIIATGRIASRMTQGRDEGEDEKRLVGVVLKGSPMLMIDNIEQPLGGDFLNTIITDGRVQVRILGQTGEHELDVHMLIYATGNNIKVRGDMIRRAIKCRMVADVERPEEREFNVDLRKFCMENRHRLVPAALTILRAFVVAPDRQDVLDKLPRYNGFERWSERVRAALVWLGESDPCADRESLRDDDPVSNNIAAVLKAWVECPALGAGVVALNGDDSWFSLGQVLATLSTLEGADLKTAIEAAMNKEGEINEDSLGRFLSKFADRRVEPYRLRKRKEPSTRRAQYLVECRSPVANGSKEE